MLTVLGLGWVSEPASAPKQLHVGLPLGLLHWERASGPEASKGLDDPAELAARLAMLHALLAAGGVCTLSHEA